MKIFTIYNGSVREGAQVEVFEFRSAEDKTIRINAIIVGESGRGRKLSVCPVELMGDGAAKLHQFPADSYTLNKCTLGTTSKGGPKLFETMQEDKGESCLVVFRTGMGFRGGNAHTGDRTDETPEGTLDFLPFPGQILITGAIAQGLAGRMGSGTQMIAVMPRDVVFRVKVFGQGDNVPAMYFKFNGKTIEAATWDNRIATDCF